MGGERPLQLPGRGDGDLPFAGVILDQAGNLYGTTAAGGNLYCNFGQEGCGVVYELTRSGSGWAESVLYAFRGGSGPDGLLPFGGLIFDQSGNLYGTTNDGGANYGGTVYELTPSNGGWTFAVLYSLGGNHGPLDSLVMDAAGNLYGTTVGDAMYGGRQHGTVFKLTPSSGGWIYTGLHAFTGGSDGGSPYGSVILDASGNLYGTASGGGAYGKGVVWEITP